MKPYYEDEAVTAPLTDEQLAEYEREIQEMLSRSSLGITETADALFQEVRRLREGLERSRRIRASMEQSMVITGEKLEKAEAERDRYREALEAIVELAGKPNLQIVRASLIARAALDQKDS